MFTTNLFYCFSAIFSD